MKHNATRVAVKGEKSVTIIAATIRVAAIAVAREDSGRRILPQSKMLIRENNPHHNHQTARRLRRDQAPLPGTAIRVLREKQIKKFQIVNLQTRVRRKHRKIIRLKLKARRDMARRTHLLRLRHQQRQSHHQQSVAAIANFSPPVKGGACCASPLTGSSILPRSM